MSDVTTVPVASGSLAGLRERVRDAETELVWLLAEGAEPLPGALDALLAAGHVPAASLPVDAAGEPVERALGRFAEHDIEMLLGAARERRVPLRHAPLVSLLVRRADVLAEAAPDAQHFGPYAGEEWSGRLFRRAPAVLVPASRVIVDAAPRGRPAEALRAARAGRWGRGATLRELYRSVRG